MCFFNTFNKFLPRRNCFFLNFNVWIKLSIKSHISIVYKPIFIDTNYINNFFTIYKSNNSGRRISFMTSSSVD